MKSYPRVHDITGQRFGRLKALKFVGVKNSNALWECICDCGKKPHVLVQSLRGGHTRSCGCIVKGGYLRNKKHGLGATKAYYAWKHMIRSCDNKEVSNYQHVGAKGISYPEEWKDIRKFVKDLGEKPPRTVLTRIDREKDFSKENCYYKTMEW